MAGFQKRQQRAHLHASVMQAFVKYLSSWGIVEAIQLSMNRATTLGVEVSKDQWIHMFKAIGINDYDELQRYIGNHVWIAGQLEHANDLVGPLGKAKGTAITAEDMPARE